MLGKMNRVVFGFLLLAVGASAYLSQISSYTSASVNLWADRMLQNLRPEIIRRNGDPLRSPDLNLPFNFSFLGSHEGVLNLTDGYIIGVSTVDRGGDCVVNYDLGFLRIDLVVGIKELLMDFKYHMEVLGLSPSGNLFAHITDQEVDIGILIDVKAATGTLQHFDMPNTGDLKLKIDGLGLLGDALASVVLAVVDNLFKTKVINSVRDALEAAINNMLENFDPLPTIPPPPSTDSMFAAADESFFPMSIFKSLFKNVHV